MDLSPEAVAAIEHARAHPFSYAMKLLEAPDGRPLVVVGEAHLKLGRAARLGAELVDAFPLRGVEGFPKKRVIGGVLLGILVEAPRLALRLASLGLVKGSTIVTARRARSGVTFALESVSRVPLALHVGALYLSLFFLGMFTTLGWAFARPTLPNFLDYVMTFLTFHMFALIPAYLLRRYAWSWWLHPMIAILTVRNHTMVEGTLAMLAEHPTLPAAMVIMGRAHVPGYAEELIARHGFRALPDEK
jgi:hypothetical protein